jgi:predicted ABC-type transport system involved in lysophospholipase L1 biosynthesis ATPase subunit
MIALLFSTGSDSVRRNLLKIVADFPIPEAAAAQLFDQCLQWMQDENRAIAVRCNAMQLLYCICQSEPDLASEVKTAILLVNNYGSAGFRSRAKKILKKLDTFD